MSVENTPQLPVVPASVPSRFGFFSRLLAPAIPKESDSDTLTATNESKPEQQDLQQAQLTDFGGLPGAISQTAVSTSRNEIFRISPFAATTEVEYEKNLQGNLSDNFEHFRDVLVPPAKNGEVLNRLPGKAEPIESSASQSTKSSASKNQGGVDSLAAAADFRGRLNGSELSSVSAMRISSSLQPAAALPTTASAIRDRINARVPIAGIYNNRVPITLNRNDERASATTTRSLNRSQSSASTALRDRLATRQPIPARSAHHDKHMARVRTSSAGTKIEQSKIQASEQEPAAPGIRNLNGDFSPKAALNPTSGRESPDTTLVAKTGTVPHASKSLAFVVSSVVAVNTATGSLRDRLAARQPISSPYAQSPITVSWRTPAGGQSPVPNRFAVSRPQARQNVEATVIPTADEPPTPKGSLGPGESPETSVLGNAIPLTSGPAAPIPSRGVFNRFFGARSTTPDPAVLPSETPQDQPSRFIIQEGSSSSLHSVASQVVIVNTVTTALRERMAARVPISASQPLLASRAALRPIPQKAQSIPKETAKPEIRTSRATRGSGLNSNPVDAIPASEPSKEATRKDELEPADVIPVAELLKPPINLTPSTSRPQTPEYTTKSTEIASSDQATSLAGRIRKFDLPEEPKSPIMPVAALTVKQRLEMFQSGIEKRTLVETKSQEQLRPSSRKSNVSSISRGELSDFAEDVSPILHSKRSKNTLRDPDLEAMEEIARLNAQILAASVPIKINTNVAPISSGPKPPLKMTEDEKAMAEIARINAEIMANAESQAKATESTPQESLVSKWLFSAAKPVTKVLSEDELAMQEISRLNAEIIAAEKASHVPSPETPRAKASFSNLLTPPTTPLRGGLPSDKEKALQEMDRLNTELLAAQFPLPPVSKPDVAKVDSIPDIPIKSNKAALSDEEKAKEEVARLNAEIMAAASIAEKFRPASKRKPGRTVSMGLFPTISAQPRTPKAPREEKARKSASRSRVESVAAVTTSERPPAKGFFSRIMVKTNQPVPKPRITSVDEETSEEIARLNAEVLVEIRNSKDVSQNAITQSKVANVLGMEALNKARVEEKKNKQVLSEGYKGMSTELVEVIQTREKLAQLNTDMTAENFSDLESEAEDDSYIEQTSDYPISNVSTNNERTENESNNQPTSNMPSISPKPKYDLAYFEELAKERAHEEITRMKAEARTTHPEAFTSLPTVDEEDEALTAEDLEVLGACEELAIMKAEMEAEDLNEWEFSEYGRKGSVGSSSFRGSDNSTLRTSMSESVCLKDPVLKPLWSAEGIPMSSRIKLLNRGLEGLMRDLRVVGL
ncbi:hypothetical protein PVAG01_08023 [Phlyctema vagabunda]|uniref:Uncharacterized protein n=1 Tax=Phlyctema vagabunda TaxID=108571 RepID=A0ABR4PE72_9HELO